jgi:uncharacterized protein YbdZ (MbtH family)
MSWFNSDGEDRTIYKVVVNHEEQYSIWPADRENPLGWSDAGKSGTKAECLEYIKEVWTDMRPLSLRRAMEQMELNPPPQASDDGTAPTPQDDLVDRLSVGDHPVEVSLRPEKNIQALKAAIDRGRVLIKFTDTRGGTELGVKLDSENCDLSHANFDNGTGKIHLEGGLTLNYVKVKCLSDIELGTLTGQGRLERLVN